MQRRSFLRSLATGAAVAPAMLAGPALLTCPSGPTNPPMPPAAAVEAERVHQIRMSYDIQCDDPDALMRALTTPIKPLRVHIPDLRMGHDREGSDPDPLMLSFVAGL